MAFFDDKKTLDERIAQNLKELSEASDALHARMEETVAALQSDLEMTKDVGVWIKNTEAVRSDMEVRTAKALEAFKGMN